MKLNLKTLIYRALVLTSTLVFTSCEGALDDIFGEWDKPAPAEAAAETPTPTEKKGSISFAKTTELKHFGDGNFTNDLTNTGDGTVTYTSSNTAVATVNPTTGEVTLVDVGTATITATVLY